MRDLFRRIPPDASILLIRLRSMGDCLLLTSPLGSLKREFPGFHVSLLVEARFRGCFEGNRDVDEVLTTDRGKLATAMELFRRRFDAIVNLHGGPTSLIYACAARGPRLGMEGYQYSRLYTALMPRPTDARLHAVVNTTRWFRWLGMETDELPPLRYEPNAKEAAWVRKTMGERPYVVIHPGAQMETKRWAAEGFAGVGRMFQDRKEAVVLTCGPGEESVVADVARNLPNSTILLGLTIPRLGELIRGADLYVGNDSGPMHLAAAVGTPIVVPWGSSASFRWHPWQAPHRIVQNPFDCNPCAGYRCEVADSPLCIESVTLEQVNRAADEMVRRPHSRPHVPVG